MRVRVPLGTDIRRSSTTLLGLKPLKFVLGKSLQLISNCFINVTR